MNALMKGFDPTRGLTAICTVVLLGLASACGGDASETEKGGSPTNPLDQPPIHLLDIPEGLGEELGRFSDGDRDDLPIVEAVAGLRHVCARDVEGAVFCWGDPAPDGSQATQFPARATRIVGAPALKALQVPVAYDRGDGQIFGLMDTTCGQAEDNQWWCWGNHHHNLSHNRPDMVTAVLVGADIGMLVPPGSEAPASVVPRLDVQAGLGQPAGASQVGHITRQVLTCGLTTAAELLCWPALRSGEDATPMASLAPGTRISGGCLLTPDGAVGCYLPFGDGSKFPLNLTQMRAMGARGCGPTQDGTWRCFGRPIGSGSVVFRDLVDVDMASASSRGLGQ